MESAREACRKAGLSESEIEAWEDHPRGQSAKADDGKPRLTVYDYRDRGRDYCRTEGSDHYQLPGVEPLDLIISCGYAEHFCLGSIIKYAVRFGESGNPEDLKKIADYAHILAGLELAERVEERSCTTCKHINFTDLGCFKHKDLTGLLVCINAEYADWEPMP